MSREEPNMSERRTFSAEFKAKAVLEMLSGHKSNAEICRQYGIGAPLLCTWKAAFLERVALVFQGEERNGQEQARIAELERLVGRQALEIEVLKKASSILAAPRRRNGSSA
jgi:transposase-like protein